VTKTAIQPITKPKARVQTALERVQEVVFSNQHDYALRLLERIYRGPELEHWRGLTLIFLGRLEEARAVLTDALALGYRGSLAPLATIQRLTSAPRDWLHQLPDHEVQALNSFDRAMLQREIGLSHLHHGRYTDSRDALQQAWNTALTGVHGTHQLSGIADSLGYVLRLLGYHAEAVHILDEGLRYSNAQRRVPLLLERAYNNIFLQRLHAVNEDLADIRIFSPKLPTEWTLPARYAFVQALYHHATGDLQSAMEGFGHAWDLADEANHNDTAFYSLLWQYTIMLELDQLETFCLIKKPKTAREECANTVYGADVYASRTQEIAQSPRHHAWLRLRDALYAAKQQNPERALTLADDALKQFAKLGAQWELGATWLTHAEIALMSKSASDFDVRHALREALGVARAIGGTVVYQTELRTLQHLSAYLEQPDLSSEFLEFITSSTSYTHVKLYPNGLEINDEAVFVSNDTVRLLRYLVQHPRSTWTHIKNAVYAIRIDEEARSELRIAARVLSMLGIHIALDASNQSYSATWNGLTLELMSEPMNLIGPAGVVN
jgi:tetratricopeptide (TPR) repeat protein